MKRGREKKRKKWQRGREYKLKREKERHNTNIGRVKEGEINNIKWERIKRKWEEKYKNKLVLLSLPVHGEVMATGVEYIVVVVLVITNDRLYNNILFYKGRHWHYIVRE